MTAAVFLGGIVSGVLLLLVVARLILWWVTPPSRLPSSPSGADAKMIVRDNSIAVLNAGSLTRSRQVIHSSSPKERDL